MSDDEKVRRVREHLAAKTYTDDPDPLAEARAEAQAELTPYDTGERLEPQPWTVELGSDPDRYGKVDFEDDESATIATVHIETTPAGTYRLVLESDFDVEVTINGQEA